MNTAKNIKMILCVLAAAFLCGCHTESIPEESTSVTESVTDNGEYSLVRGWTGAELLNSIFYCGEYRSLPLDIEEIEGFSFSDDILAFPDGSYASASVDEDGRIIAIKFERSSAPSDFSVYGIDFLSRPDDIPKTVGIADSIVGNRDETIVYSFYGGGITELTFVYTEKNLASVYICKIN